MTFLQEAARSALAGGRLDLPPLGGGQTPLRWEALVSIAADDVDLARLAEAHVDAVQILAEAGLAAAPGQLYGVWASEHPANTVTGRWVDGGDRLLLSGSKAFCSGAGIVDTALLTVTTPEGGLLVQVPSDAVGHGRIDTTAWQVRALSDVRTATVDFQGVSVEGGAVIGRPDWYLDRPGFWEGAIGPAACWAGAAIGLVHHALAQATDDPHKLAHMGAMSAGERALRSLLDAAGREQDTLGSDPTIAQRRALEVRHLVDTWCADIEARFSRCLGPRALALDAAAADRLQGLSIYRRQCHGERDLAALGVAVSAVRTVSAEKL
jgi:alkylation response protein AidB-like acyl-CoA dehydrogenase